MLKEQISNFITKNETKLEIAFFVGGFIFDIWMLAAPDEIFSILQQLVYLLIIASLIHFELLHRLNSWRPNGLIISKIWAYRTLGLHFLLGSLLSVYSLFYIKSSSIFSSLFFLAFMIALLFANELPQVKKSNVSLKVGLYSICLFSFLSILFPILFGFVGFLPFLCAILTTLGLFYFQFLQLTKVLPNNPRLLKALLAPAGSILVIFFVFYFLGWIPPVPLSVKTQGIYHLVEKKDANYHLYYEPRWPAFLYSADSDFNAQPNDKIYFFAEIYSPARISDEVLIHWYQKLPNKGWMLADKIPLKFQGGREKGYRGFAFKTNYTAGEWKIEVRTSSGIEISRLYFDVISQPTSEIRNFTVIVK